MVKPKFTVKKYEQLVKDVIDPYIQSLELQRDIEEIAEIQRMSESDYVQGQNDYITNTNV